MFPVVRKEVLNPSTVRLVVRAPEIAAAARAGQFVVLRADSAGERIPITVERSDTSAGTISLVILVAGATTRLLSHKNAGDVLADVVGPLGVPDVTKGYERVLIIGGGVGCAVALPVARQMHIDGAYTHALIGFRSADRVMLVCDFQAASDVCTLLTEDGTAGTSGRVTDELMLVLQKDKKYDLVFAAGPLPMMRAVSEMTRPFGIKTVVSMNPIMIDGTGMCGVCRITVDGTIRFACVEGPSFDGHLVDYEEAIARASFYRDHERETDAHICRLLGEVRAFD